MTDDLIEDPFDIPLYHQPDCVHRAHAQRLEPMLVRLLEGFNFPGVFLQELCLVVIGMRNETRMNVALDGAIEDRLDRIVRLVGDLNRGLDSLQVSETMSLSLYMTDPADYSKLKQPGKKKIPLKFETLAVLPAIQDSLSKLGEAAAVAVKDMRLRRGGKPATKLPVQKINAGYVKQVAKLVQRYTKVIPGRGKDFKAVCGVVFECAGITTKPDGAIKEFLSITKPKAKPTPKGVTIHKIR